MRILNNNQLNDFLKTLDKCHGSVWLESPEGDRYNLMSLFSRYISLGELLSEHGDMMELYCSDPNDEQLFFKFLKDHPEV